MDTVDKRLPGSDLGYKYAERIMEALPLLFITPCKQKFMPTFSAQDKETVLSSLISGNTDAMSAISSKGRYYTTEFAYSEYYSYVNTMCTEVAYFLGIGDEVVTIGGNINKKVKPEDAVDIVIAGGTSSPKGFDVLFEKVAREAKLPMKIGSIIRTPDPLYSVARGCLIAAENAK